MINHQSTPKDLDPVLVERFLFYAPKAAQRLKNKFGSKLNEYDVDDLVHSAYANGYWWKYGERNDMSLFVAIKYDMMKNLAIDLHDPLMRGPGTAKEIKGVRLKRRNFPVELWDSVMHRISTDPAPGEEIERRDFFYYVIMKSGLSQGEKVVLFKRYVEEKRALDVAVEMGITSQMVHLYERRAFAKIRPKLEGKGYGYTK